MNHVFTIYSIFFLATALVSFFVAFMAWNRRTVKGAREITRMTIAAGIWAFFIIFETAARSVPEKLFWAKLEYFGAVSTPVFYLIFVLRFTGKDRFLQLKYILLLFIVPLITLLFTLTNEYHYLVWSGFSAISEKTNLMEYSHGLWFWFGYMAYNDLLLLLATFFLFQFIIRHTSAFRSQGVIIFIAGLCPWITSLAYLLGLNPVPGLDITPVSNMVSGALLAYAIFYLDFLDLAPVARETLVETLPDGILALDRQNRIQDINAAALSFLGIPHKKIIGSPALSSGASVTLLLNAAIDQEPVDQIEIRSDHEIKTFKIIKQAIKSQPGSRLIVIRDITIQVARQMELRAMEERYRSMFTMFRLMADNMPDMLWAKDLSKKFMFTNKAVCENLINATDTDEPTGKNDMFFAERARKKHPERSDWYTFGELCQDSDQVVINSGKPEHFDEFGNVNGKFLFLDVQKAPIFTENGEMIGVVGSARDVTLQKKTESEIYKRDKLLDAIAQATSMLIQGENLDTAIHGALEIIGKATEVNRVYIFRNHDDRAYKLPMMSQHYEWTDGSVEPQIDMPELQNLPYESGFSRWFDVLSKGNVIAGNIREFPESEQIILGPQEITSIFVTPVLIDKQFWGFIGFDECRREREWTPVEERLLSAAANTIGAAYLRKKNQDELLAAKEKAEESDRLKTTFLANMSHEIRTPMNAITGFAGLLIDPDISPEDRSHFVNIIQSRSDDLMRIINDILEISRIESGNATIEKGKVNLNRMLAEIETVTTRKIERLSKSHLAFVCDTPCTQEDVAFVSDPFIIKQVFTNLIDNAIKFTHTGSVRYGYQPPENGRITCYVTDSGIGISPENQTIIFEHFRQAERQNLHQYGGTGLGLSICKGSLALLEGDIRVESTPGKGSTFYFSLPFDHPASIIPHPASWEKKPDIHTTSGLYNWSGKKILLVEDEDTNLKLLNIILKHTGAELISARNGKEVRQLYNRLDMFDLVLLDVRLPDASGLELAKEIKALRPSLPMIMQTAYAMSSDREKSIEAGCDDHISKPINRDQLLVMMAGYLD